MIGKFALRFLGGFLAITLLALIEVTLSTAPVTGTVTREQNETMNPKVINPEVAICLLGFCVDVPPILKPLEKPIENEINEVIKNQLRSFLADEIPISGTEHQLYPTTSQLPGGQFTSQTLYLNALNASQVIPSGDYEIPVHFYCTKVYTLNGGGNRYRLARLNGRLSDALSALYQRASVSDAPIQDVQVLSWSIQSGVSYDNLSSSSKQLVNQLIPDYKQKLDGSFIDKTIKYWNDLSRLTSLPSLDSTLNSLGDTGTFVKSLFRARDEIIRTNFNYRNLANAFVIPQDVNLPGGVETTPWSKINDQVYLRFMAPKGALNDGVVQVRILGQGQTNEFNRINLLQNNTDSNQLIASLPNNNSLGASSVTAEALLSNISQSVGIPEQNGQALTATVTPAPENRELQEAREIARQLQAEPTWKEMLDPCPCTLEEARKLSAPIYSLNGKELSPSQSSQIHYKIETRTGILPEGELILIRDRVFVESSQLALSFELPYHPGASYVFRSHSSRVGYFKLKSGKVIKPGQQCTYNAQGQLITDGPGAGTPDAYSSEVTATAQGWRSEDSHTFWDTNPFDAMTNNREKGWEQKEGWKEYHKTWTPNTGNGCPLPWRRESNQI
ncbi:hypothetical protein [Gloeothece citriformis]|uniref:hypothetical protein n=1 Tax=Gloeothece citriformis TaxID=2546356 RepID=UPI0012FEBFD8|nr:hypothetical protein [Gloeothece citriformis]